MAAANGYILNVYELDLTPIGERHLQLPIRIGRSSLNDVFVSHRLVSEFHARIEEVDGKLCVRDLSSKNGVLVETVGTEGATRVTAQLPIDLEPYGYEFLLSPLLRVRVRPASEKEGLLGRHSQALGSVLGNTHGAVAVRAAAALAEDRSTEAFSHEEAAAYARSAAPAPLPTGYSPTPRVPPTPALRPTPVAPRPVEPARILSPRPRTAPSPVPPPPLPPLASGAPSNAASSLPYSSVAPAAPAARDYEYRPPPFSEPASAAAAVQPYTAVMLEPPALGVPSLPRVPEPASDTRRGHAVRRATLLEPGTAPLSPEPVQRAAQPVLPRLAHTAWEPPSGTLPAAAVGQLPPPEAPLEPPGRSLEALALRGLRELAASLVPGQPVESASDVVQLVTKLHDSLEMFCRCFIPVREACSRFVPPDELERAAVERCRQRSSAYLAIERALEPRAVATALLDWRDDAQDAPRAVEHILADLMLHHLALSQAALEGTRALLDELSPKRIEAQQPEAGVLSRLTGSHERTLWESFAERHAQLEAVGRSFREIFGEEFTRAFAAHFPPPGAGPSL